MAERRPAGTPIHIPALAKINLYLHVVGRRPDGYHRLESLVAFAGVGDRITIAPAETLSFRLEGPRQAGVPPGDDNLTMRAARALAKSEGIVSGARITLAKHLPTAAGLGGGSADAAATLRGLATLWGVGDETRLAALAPSLGADLPVCLFGRAAFVGGIGERIQAAPGLPPAWLVLANPGVALATPDVFKAYAGPFSKSAPPPRPSPNAATLVQRLATTRNDLQEPAIRLAPAVDETLAALCAQPECLLARMSGSGATCFGLFATADAANRSAATLRAAHSDWWIEAAPLVSDVRRFAVAAA